MEPASVPARGPPSAAEEDRLPRRNARRHSYPWKIVWSETSFYIRPWLADEYEGPSWHLSFHGPSADKKPPGFRIRWDDARKVLEGFGRVFRDLITERAGRKGWWTGQDVADGVRHA